LGGVRIPGFVDLQVNGYKGVDFSDVNLTPDDFERACRGIFDSGTTAFLATVVTSPKEVYEHNLPIIAAAKQRDEFRGRLLGLHIEGPFISPIDGARGAHDSKWVARPDVDLLEQLIEWADDGIKILTIAAELEGAEDLARYATERGIRVSLGHQMAKDEDLTKLVQAGAISLTHLGNGVPLMLDRHENPIWAGLTNDDLVAMIVSDGHHLPVSLLKTIIRTKGTERCVIVSDATFPAGLKSGRYHVLGHDVMLDKAGRLYDPQTGYLAGSSAMMLDCVNHLASLDLASFDELMAMGFYNPLKLIGLSPKDVGQGRDVYYDEENKAFYFGEQG
jgi:N-acetylglucosamine-6-phosphate deacetylase